MKDALAGEACPRLAETCHGFTEGAKVRRQVNGVDRPDRRTADDGEGKARQALPLAREIAKEAAQYLPEGDSEREDYANLLRIVLEQQKK